MSMTRIRRMSAIAVLLALSPMPSPAAKGPKLPYDAPYCAPPHARQVFLSPMGEPFRAAAGQPYPSAAWLAGADADKDGAIDRNEFLADARRFFETLDLDHDGRLTPEEVVAYERDVAPEVSLYVARGTIPLGESIDSGRASRRGGAFDDLLGMVSQGAPAGSDYGGAMGAGRYSWLNIPEPVSAADADVDRLVSQDEFLAAAGRRFDALTQGRGALRLADLGKTPAQMSLEGPCRSRPKPRKQADDRREEGHGRSVDQGEGPR